MPGPLPHCQFILFATGPGCSPRSLHPLGGTTIANCVPLFKELTRSSARKPELLLIPAQTQDACRGEGESMSLPLTSDLIQLLQAKAYLLRFGGKNVLVKQLDGQLPRQVLKPVSLKKMQKAQAILLLHRG